MIKRGRDDFIAKHKGLRQRGDNKRFFGRVQKDPNRKTRFIHGKDKHNISSLFKRRHTGKNILRASEKT